MRNSDNAVDICRDRLGINNLVPVDSVSFCCIQALFRGLLPNRYADDIEILSVILVINRLDVRNLILARTAPGSPEINEDILSVAYIV